MTKRMTINRFLILVKKHLAGGWSEYNRVLRRIVRGGCAYECPICALDYELNKPSDRKYTYYTLPAERLGLTIRDAHRIAEAADDGKGHDPVLRAQIKKALGVSA